MDSTLSACAMARLISGMEHGGRTTEQQTYGPCAQRRLMNSTLPARTASRMQNCAAWVWSLGSNGLLAPHLGREMWLACTSIRTNQKCGFTETVRPWTSSRRFEICHTKRNCFRLLPSFTRTPPPVSASDLFQRTSQRTLGQRQRESNVSPRPGHRIRWQQALCFALARCRLDVAR